VFVCLLNIQFLVKTTIATETSTVEYLLGCSKYVYQLKIHICFVDYRPIRKRFLTFLYFLIVHLIIDTPILDYKFSDNTLKDTLYSLSVRHNMT
jgi:hypothetical protein